MTENGDNEQIRWSRERGSEIKDRDLKLKFFYEWDVGVGPERIRCCHQFPFRNRKAMAIALSLGEAQLKGGSTQKDSLSKVVMETLGQYFGFDPAWHEFLCGTAWDFAKKYNAENWYLSKPQFHRMPSPKPLRQRQNGLLLSRGPRQEPSRSKIVGLASVEVDGYQFGSGTASIEVVVSCGMVPILGRNTTIQRALIELDLTQDCGAAILTDESYMGWLKSPLRNEIGSHGAIAIHYGGGDRSKPIWHLVAGKAGIGNLILEPGFATAEGLTPGDAITVRLGTWLMDIQEADANCFTAADNLIDSIALVGGDGTELTAAVPELSALKRNVIACIRKTLLPDDNGYVVVASHTLHVVEVARDD
jgi:hypothetical protein